MPVRASRATLRTPTMCTSKGIRSPLCRVASQRRLDSIGVLNADSGLPYKPENAFVNAGVEHSRDLLALLAEIGDER